MRSAIYTSLLCALFIASHAQGNEIHGGSPTGKGSIHPNGHILYISVPKDISREDVLHPDETLKTRLRSLVRKHLTSQNISPRETGDLIIIYNDHDGRPILPDLEAAKSPKGSKGPAWNELTFTYDSPDYPWSEVELAVLRAASQELYPIIKDIYGYPAFNITVNVRKEPSLVFPGDYSPTTNEIVLRGVSQLDVFCHEMIHAFRDDNIIMLSSYEEGMTVAAEVAVLNRLNTLAFWDEHHSYPYDVYYEGLNRHVIGSPHGIFDNNSPLLLLDYQLAGYAWAKVFLENSDFFIGFNKKLYSRSLSDPTIRSTESTLLEIAETIQSTVEGKPFLAWYGQQGIFNTDPPAGYFLYQNISNFTIYYFHRNLSGIETFQPDAVIQWAVYDYKDELLDWGSDVTSSLGWISLHPMLPLDHQGRIKIVATAFTPEGMITDTTMRSIGEEKGVFGIVTDADFGSIAITPLDDDTPPVSTSVINGAFSAPSLTTAKGRFIAVFTDTTGRVFSKEFTKDSSNYFLLMTDAGTTAVRDIEQLLGDVNCLVSAAILNQGQGSALAATLQAAIGQTGQDKTVPAVKQLRAFVEHVNALMQAGVLSYAQGRPLISGADDIVVRMTENQNPPEQMCLMKASDTD